MPPVVHSSRSFVDDVEDAEVVVAPDSSVVSLPPGLIKRFYATTIFHSTLENTINRSQKKTPSDVEDTTSWSDEKSIFHRFVNRLAHICDSKPGGDTVTAVAVLAPGSIEYRLTSNQRSPVAYDSVRRYLWEDILGLLRDASDDDINNKLYVSVLSSSILLNILRFARRRVKCYVKLLVDKIDFCIQWCDRDANPTGMVTIVQTFVKIRESNLNKVKLASETLRLLQARAQMAMAQWSDPDECKSKYYHQALIFPSLSNKSNVSVAKSARILVSTIKTHQPTLGSLLSLKASNSDLPGTASSTSWTDIHHAIGRLNSYSIAVKGIVDARRRWPMLFASFEVTHVPSRPRYRNPINIKQAHCNAKHILSSLNKADQRVVTAYEEVFVQTLSLDDTIKEELKSENYNTLVHAEANLLDNIYRCHLDPDLELGSARFFDERKFGRYIGISKETCVLCRLFFDAHPFRVERRQSHGTLYAKWRAPDVFKEDSAELAETRRKVVYQMADEMKKIVSLGILDRTGGGRRYDSRHETSDPLRTVGSWSARGSLNGQINDFSSTVGVVGASGLVRITERTEMASAVGREQKSVTDDLNIMMGTLTLRNAHANPVIAAGRKGSREDAEVGDDDDDVDGGVRL
ncbi:hypothetical protein QBC43DRAFT_349857 [Cladorrhinum sp. PSN259]|nr:hypothetical protein QBC43DRAFT_349857 [Cladorrhinum sp. PSN259]